jgi:hypothetical protein
MLVVAVVKRVAVVVALRAQQVANLVVNRGCGIAV